MEADGAAGSSAWSPGEGLCTDMRAVRKDYFLDHDHSAYVDQWDWERAITAEERTLDYLKDDRAPDLVGAARAPRRTCSELLPALRRRALPAPARGDHVHPRRGPPRRATRTCRASSGRPAILQEVPAVFIIGIGWTLDDGYPHEMRAADYDDWVTDDDVPTDGRPCTGSTATSSCGTR